jgi:Uma2 family endonuclease
MSAPPKRATIDDLMRHPGKAELINGSIHAMSPTGFRPGRIAFLIAISLDQHTRATGQGLALPDNVGYRVPPLTSGRESFAPDASFFLGLPPQNPMRFLESAPAFAVEVRSKTDYGPAAEREMAEKRADYFEAGTLVVWDVCPQTREARKYVSHQDMNIFFRMGDTADAEPAVPGWTMSVADMIEQL